jgi:MoxR-like ATPase
MSQTADSIVAASTSPAVNSPPSDLQSLERLHVAYHRIREEMAKVIVGQDDVVEQLLVALFARGHCLLLGVPGLAKTLMIQTLARTLGLSFNRIQFTPDLMPSDITGTELLAEDRQTGQREFRFVRGPVFANVILADEINRTPPKTQAALLEAMQEHQVTAGGRRHPIDEPFFVLATQNPIEQEGTYPLPEAQLDRFMLNIVIGYPSEDEELEIVRRTTGEHQPQVEPILAAEELLHLQGLVRRMPLGDHVIRYALRLTRLTRRDQQDSPAWIKDFLSWGAGPRGSQYLILAAKARAALRGQMHVATDDVRAVALPVLRHRLITNFRAESEGVRPDDIIRRIIQAADSQGKS